MAKTLQFRRGTNQELDGITGAEGELFVDLTQQTIRVHDGSVTGGIILAKTSDTTQAVVNANAYTDDAANTAYANAVAEAETLANTAANTAYANAVAYVDLQTTDTIEEGNTNLYWIEAPNDSEQYVRQNESWVVVDIPEGYDTNNFDSDFANQTTDDLSEGNTNLYYLDSRVDSHLSGANGLSYSTGVISADQDISSGANINFNKVTGLSAPVATSDAANKQYVDEVAEGLQARGSAQALSDSNLSATYANNTLTSTSNGAFPTVDGVTLDTQFDRLLVTGQSNAAHNGLYVLSVVGDGSTPWELIRCDECNEDAEIPGSFVFVQSGTEYGSSGWVAIVGDKSTFTLGTDDINWTQFSGAGTFTAGEGLELNGSQFSLDSSIAGDYLSYATGVLDVQASAADSANTLVLRDNNGDITANGFIGDGSALTNIDYDNLVNTPNSELEVLSSASTIDLDVSNSINFNITLTQNTTFTFSGLASAEGQSGLIVINQDGTGSHEFTLPSQAKTPVGGAQIDQVTNANSSSVINYLVVNTNAVFINYIGDFQ